MSFKRIKLLIWKEFLHLKRDTLLLRLLIIMPILQLLLLGYVVGADIKDLKMAVVDLDQSPISRKLESAFTSSGFFQVTKHLASETEMKPLLDDGEILITLVIPHGVGISVASGQVSPIGLVVDGSNAQISSVASGYATQIIQEFNAKLVSSNDKSMQIPRVDARIRVEYNPTINPINTMIPALMCTIIMISLVGTMALAVVREQESGVLEQIFVTPIRPSEYIVGKITPYALAASLQVLFAGTVGAWWFQVPFIGNFWVALCGMALFLLASIGTGLLISLVSSTRQQAQQAVALLLLPSIVLSGFVFPIESMPTWVAWITNFIPITHVLTVIRGAFMKHSDFVDLTTPLLALIAFAVVLFTSAVFATRHRLTN